MSNNIFENISQAGKVVFSILQKEGPHTKQNILEKTGMKLTTLNRVMKPLEEAELIQIVDIAESTGGRKPVVYGVDTRNYHLIGIDISRTYTKTVITNLSMKIEMKKSFEMDENCSPEVTVAMIVNNIQDMLNELNIDIESILGVGLGTVGPLDRKNGIMINPKHFPAKGWDEVPIKMLLQKQLNMPVIIDNGSNTALLAEQHFGIGKGYSNTAYFNCGVGIRTGVSSNYNIIRTALDSEDAFAHTVVDMSGKKCTCGNYGCIDCYSTIIAIVNEYITGIKKGRKTTIEKHIGKIDYKDICFAADSGEEWAKEVLLNAALVFGIGLNNFINILNPQLIILSGPLVRYSNLFYKVCTETIQNRSIFREHNKVIFSKGGKFGQSSIAVGAAVLAIENYL